MGVMPGVEPLLIGIRLSPANGREASSSTYRKSKLAANLPVIERTSGHFAASKLM
jgi:hypothetical protein